MRGIPPATLEEVVTNRALREPARPALLWHERAILLGRLAGLIASRAEAVSACLPPGSTIACLMSNTPGLVSTTLAVWRAGSSLAPLDPWLAPAEIARRLAHSGASGLVVHEEHVERAEAALRELEAGRRGAGRIVLLVSQGVRLVPGRLGPRPRSAARGRPRASDVAFIAYPPEQSGPARRSAADATPAGAPRAIVLTHTNVMASALRSSIARGDGPEDVALATHPLWNVSALVSEVLSRFVTGAPVALLPRPDVGLLAAAIEQHRATDISLSSDLRALVTESSRLPARAIRSVRKVLSPADRVPMTVRRALADRFPDAEMIETYGRTEATDGILIARHGVVFRKPDTLGIPLPGLVVSILDPAGRALKPRQVGEIACRGAVVMRGYHRAPALTRAVLGDGSFRTGDLGCIDGDGEVQLVRAREMARDGRTA